MLIAHSTSRLLPKSINQSIPKQEVILRNSNKHKLLEIVFKSLDNLISNFLDLPLHPIIDPSHVLSRYFAPVDELPPTACQVVEGSLPSCLNGSYIRNGPNPQFIPNGPYHLYDGDGMLHLIKISQGEATFCSRYVKTYKYLVEREMGSHIFPSVFASFNGFGASMARCVVALARGLAGQFNPLVHGLGAANTSVAQFGGRLFALSESDLPYEIKVTSTGDIVTLGRHYFQNIDHSLRMSAHPKVDPETGETFTFSYNINRPFLTFFRINPDGRIQATVPILSLEKSSMTHDFAVTENYAIFPDIQIIFSLKEIMRGRSPVIIDHNKVPRIGIISKYANDDSEMSWITVPGLNILHVANAWEEDGGDTVVMLASYAVSAEEAWENHDLTQFRMEKMVINMKSKTLERFPLSTKILEFGGVNPARAGQKTRYIYSAMLKTPEMSVGLVKLDLSINACDDCIVASRLYGPGCIGGEPIFVPNDPSNMDAEEDDGYLITYMHNENTNESTFLVMDAKSPSLETVAVVKLPQRVPSGFHGLFVPEDKLQQNTNVRVVYIYIYTHTHTLRCDFNRLA
ncbi:putative carotenoid cleavage dioxygenase 4, chloroplastic-like [Dorcoceras hygrometricum]|uniref:Putative carotenoid cleavage dioxygenase 4, chloroplastic-like n=1 Tax=Dorcoceras hygrometricum TaxID=472368 RepID=A0A2Z7BHW8_9LAMI|nr:putative carotenoid cleavage dioxygenase 4, chloroplastic-like [Dorcoceras hygrometricum]